jgi:hypothetical protein
MLASILIFFFLVHYSKSTFPPNGINYNDYGSKIAMNELILVEVQNENNPPTFLVQFSPYNNTPNSFQCSISYQNITDHYIYTVALAKNQTQFFFVGELINGQNGTFIGVVKYNSSASTCDTSFSFSLQYFFNYTHQEYYVIGIEPKGRFAYGFSNEFIYIYDSQMNSIVNLWNGNLTWLHNSFMPHAVQLTGTFGITAGFIRNPLNTKTIYIPIIYLINFNSSNNYPIIVDQYLPNATFGTWQDLLSNSDAETYFAKYDMSISIDNKGNILVGMQFINRIFYLSVNLTQPMKLNFISRNTNGRSLGNGKAVAWLDNGIAAILVNIYSLTYQWSSSEINFYDILNNGYNTNSTPLSVFPNNHQLLPFSFSSILVNIISSPSSLALLDNLGNILVLNPTLPGFYPSVVDTGTIPVFTVPQPCLPGTYKNQTGVYDCSLCPSGTKNHGNSSLQCLPCSKNSFCPLGSVDEVPYSALHTIVQVQPYPESPESTIFDEILIQNMFNIGTGHCLRVSPLFWTLMVATFVIIMIIIMGILKICIDHPRSKKIRHRLKWLFKHTDLINEGELWIGGLASFCLIILVCFAYSFSGQFLKQYPLEYTSDSNFACDVSLRNAKFQTNIQSLSIPAAEFEQNMINSLNNQTFTLNVDFINTIMDCSVVSLQALYGTRWLSIRWSTCNNINSILSLSIPLSYQQISVQIFLADIQTIGGLRIGLSGPGDENEHYNRRELYFYQSFYKNGQILAQTLPIVLDITKVINETAPMIGEESDFSGIYIPTFTMDSNSLFLTADQYMSLNTTLTTFTIDIHETPYYIKNMQQPIAKSSEIIFHNLLFTIVCLEIFGLGFLLYKLIIKPICCFLFPQHFRKKNKIVHNEGIKNIIAF